MSLRVDESFSARRVSITLNGVPTSVEVEIYDDVADGIVHVQADVALLRGRGVNVSCSSDGDELKIAVTVGRASGGISIRNSGDAIVSGDGVANTGVMLGGHDDRTQQRFVEVTQSVSLHHDTGPKVAMKLSVGPDGILCRVTP